MSKFIEFEGGYYSDKDLNAKLWDPISEESYFVSDKLYMNVTEIDAVLKVSHEGEIIKSIVTFNSGLRYWTTMDFETIKQHIQLINAKRA